jgi:hypothetical protein
MKALLFFVAVASLFFTACQNDNDFATPQDFQTAILDQTLATTDGTMDLSATCMDVKTDHAMDGKGSALNVFSIATRGTYAITARGDVNSEPLGAGTTTAQFTYNPRTRMLSGGITSNFESGAQLEQRFQGAAQQASNGNTMTLTVNLTSATLSQESTIFNLASGSITITIPTIPIGYVTVTSATIGSYCQAE